MDELANKKSSESATDFRRRAEAGAKLGACIPPINVVFVIGKPTDQGFARDPKPSEKNFIDIDECHLARQDGESEAEFKTRMLRSLPVGGVGYPVLVWRDGRENQDADNVRIIPPLPEVKP